MKKFMSALAALTILSAIGTSSVPAFAESENSYELISSTEYDVLSDENVVLDIANNPLQIAALTPKITCDIVYNSSASANRKYRVDVKFSNMPDLLSAGFHVNVGAGWNIVTKNNGDPDILYSSGTFGDANMHTMSKTANTLFFTMANSPSINFNGNFISFYVTKKSNNTPSNSAINISFITGDMLINSSGNNIAASVSTPVMLQANQYIIGDANGDGCVNALDASVILSATQNNPLDVYCIRKTYKNYFPNAASPSAPDAYRDGCIDSYDADCVLYYYSKTAIGQAYNGSIGTVDVYEIFD